MPECRKLLALLNVSLIFVFTVVVWVRMAPNRVPKSTGAHVTSLLTDKFSWSNQSENSFSVLISYIMDR